MRLIPREEIQAKMSSGDRDPVLPNNNHKTQSKRKVESEDLLLTRWNGDHTTLSIVIS